LDRQREFHRLKQQELQTELDIARERQRSLLGAGPADLLRKLAAAQFGPRTDLGSLLAADPRFRQELQLANPDLNPDLASIRSALRRLRPESDGELTGALAGLQSAGGALRRQLPAFQRPPGVDLALEPLFAVAEGARSAATALKLIPAAVEQVLAAARAGGGGGRGQFGGWAPGLPA
ncbi:MAG TPA: hypothetical protein PKE47_12750, partial [Verrucomicrobiota bacterium]|nr:hypothetical protein [Verrucomicrobiota bacterium]